MKNLIRLSTMLLFLIAAKESIAQMAAGIPHVFGVTMATPVAYPTVGATPVAVPAARIDDWDTLISPPGFSFVFAGKTYTKIVVSTNGWLALLPSSVVYTPPTLQDPMPINNLGFNATGYPIIAPLWDDLSTTLISYNMSGNSLWVRWTAKWNKTNVAAASSLFWIKLDRTDNSITFNYANNAAYVPVTPSASIGIAGECPGDFYSAFCTASNAAYVDSVIENPNIGQGGATTMRPYNCYYTFTPACFNDNCNMQIYLGTVNNCLPYPASTINATNNGTGNCVTSDVKDVWFSVDKPLGVSGVTISTFPDSCNSVTGTSIEVYSDCTSLPIVCSTTGTIPAFGEVQLLRSDTVAERLYIRVTSDADQPGKFLICASNNATIAVNDITENSIAIYYSQGKLIIEFESTSANNSFVLFNLEGAKIQEGKISSGKNSITCENLSKGIYVVKVAIGNRFYSRKVVYN